MKARELIKHLTNFINEYGDVDVYVDADIWRNTMPMNTTSVRVLDILREPQFIVDGQFPNENVEHRMVIYVGNEPRVTIGPSKFI